MPPAPWTTNARRAPSRASTSAITRHELRRVDADDLRARAGRVRQRPEHVEHGARGELAPHRRRVPHRRMVRRREHEAEAELVDRLARSAPAAARARSRAPRARRPSRSATRPTRLPCFATPAPAAAATSAAAVEMLNVLPPSPPVPAVSTRSSRCGLHRQRRARASPRRSRRSRPPSRPSAAARRGSRRSARASPRRHDRVHHARAPPRARGRWPSSSCASASWITRPSRKFRAMSRPIGVSTDSGWNCTPSTGSSRWRTAITSPSARGRRDLERVGDRRRRERVVAAGLEVLGQPGEEAAAVVRDDRRLAVHELACAGPTSPPNDLDDRLVAEADAERRRRGAAAVARSRSRRRRPRAGRARGRRRGGTGAGAPPRPRRSRRSGARRTSAPSSPKRCARL